MNFVDRQEKSILEGQNPGGIPREVNMDVLSFLFVLISIGEDSAASINVTLRPKARGTADINRGRHGT